MDHQRFDVLTRELTSAISRRGLAALLTAGFGSTAGATAARAGKRRKRKKKRTSQGCPPCGECRTCQNGTCVSVADNIPCGQCGRCLNGACANALDRANLCGACATCEAGACIAKPVYTPCDGSPGLCTLPAVCYDGACNEGVCYLPPAPFCTAISDACTANNECCSGVCCKLFGFDVRYCCQSNPGGLCLTDGDCVEGASCVAYRCYTWLAATKEGEHGRSQL